MTPLETLDALIDDLLCRQAECRARAMECDARTEAAWAEWRSLRHAIDRAEDQRDEMQEGK